MTAHASTSKTFENGTDFIALGLDSDTDSENENESRQSRKGKGMHILPLTRLSLKLKPFAQKKNSLLENGTKESRDLWKVGRRGKEVLKSDTTNGSQINIAMNMLRTVMAFLLLGCAT
jgi:hypothetical protein